MKKSTKNSVPLSHTKNLKTLLDILQIIKKVSSAKITVYYLNGNTFLELCGRSRIRLVPSGSCRPISCVLISRFPLLCGISVEQGRLFRAMVIFKFTCAANDGNLARVFTEPNRKVFLY